jgi:hypothetical protein
MVRGLFFQLVRCKLLGQGWLRIFVLLDSLLSAKKILDCLRQLLLVQLRYLSLLHLLHLILRHVYLLLVLVLKKSYLLLNLVQMEELQAWINHAPSILVLARLCILRYLMIQLWILTLNLIRMRHILLKVRILMRCLFTVSLAFIESSRCLLIGILLILKR